MAPRRLLASPRAGAQLRAAFDAIRDEVAAPGAFPPEVLAEAESAARAPVGEVADLTSVPFVTIDPAGSTDLDQAMALERVGSGYRVRYAIADVGGFVRPGGPMDRDAHARGLTLYCPDTRVPLTPPVLSEGAASLLPGVDRPAAVWSMRLDAGGDCVDVEVRRALVRSRAQLSFDEAQHAIDQGTDEQLALLREIGRLRQARERERGGVSVTLPEQEVVARNGSYELAYRAPLPVEDWNAQLSLLTGSAAAGLMLKSGTGVLRTMPAPDERDLAELRRTAAALDVDWPQGVTYAELVPTLDPVRATHAAFLTSAMVLLRGAGYTVFDGAPPELATHSAVGGSYAHVTAPLRRLVDRHATALCLAACAGLEPPDWVRAALPSLPSVMGAAQRRAGEVERQCVEVVEAAVLHDRVGEVFAAVVVDMRRDGGGVVQLAEPAVRARCEPGPTVRLGDRIDVRLVRADPAERVVRFAPVDASGQANTGSRRS